MGRAFYNKTQLHLALIRKEWQDRFDPNERVWKCAKCERYRYEHKNQPLPDLYDADKGYAKNTPEMISKYQIIQMGNPCVYEPKPSGYFTDEYEETVTLNINGREATVPKLYKILRRPYDTGTVWARYEINGQNYYPDSLPIGVEKLPRDAVALTEEEMIAYWSR